MHTTQRRGAVLAAAFNHIDLLMLETEELSVAATAGAAHRSQPAVRKGCCPCWTVQACSNIACVECVCAHVKLSADGSLLLVAVC